MRIVFGSDIHGSAEAGERLVAAARRERADLLVLCGDIYYHGPRNPLPGGYEPMRLADLLNQNKEFLRCVRGNCDSEVDAMISEFEFEQNIVLEHNDKTIFVTHGHVYDKNNAPAIPFDMMIYGHYHVCFIEKKDGKIYASPGSTSLPKGGTKPAYLLLDQTTLTLKDLFGHELGQVEL